ncbi:spermine oxidase-like [Rhinatrema bivittatum]|uniref:spermine oxidase-like n=1 Tax=Rhinatrema bivittatum TaxID=194408 RepID=UPI0011271731|nr:spermine oxidase-like [Rhinatrema bivittatum]XP_029460834.1 spermine oxidase-like [Rhinatrema bivittatum]
MASRLLSSEPKIVIIGAGFAGLAAASTLLKQGLKNVLVLEAMDRVGGRVQTVRPFGTNVIEMGATWIHGQKDNPLYELAREEELLAEEGIHVASCLPGVVTPQDYFFTEHSKLLSSNRVEKITGFFGNIMSKIFSQDFKSDCSSWSLGDYLDQEFEASGLSDMEDAGIVFEWCKRAECTDEACNSIYEFSLNQLGLYTPLEGPFFNCLGVRGYQAILDVLLRYLPVSVLRCKKPVKCIHWTDSPGNTIKSKSHPVRIICEDGEQFLADHVIITVSLGCLKERALSMFEPPLPQEKLEAIVKLGFGTVSKIFLEFEERFWPEDCVGIQLLWDKGPENKDVYNVSKQNEGWKKEWFKKIGGFDMVAHHDNVLCGWITGRAAEFMETLPEEEVGEVCVRLLRNFTGWSISNLRAILRSAWHSNPYTRGSYTNVPVGVDALKEQMALAEPVPSTYQKKKMRPLQVLFAGEATHTNFYTTTHGAYLSGVREAERLLLHHGVSPRL